MPVQVENISKTYGSQKALDQLSFRFDDGELVGFLGPNGAGKSTLMKILTGYLAPDEGQVILNGEKMTSENYALRRHIGYLPENNPLYTDLYVKEFLSFAAGFYQLQHKKQKVAEAIEMTGLGLEQHKKIGALSKGYRQRVGLAQALIHNPSVLILDEPTTGLDPNQLDDIRALIRQISREKTVLFSSHIMQEVEAICNRVIIINRGKIVTDGPVELVRSAQLVTKQQVLVELSSPVDRELWQKLPGVDTVEILSEKSFLAIALDERDLRPAIFQFAVEQGLIILTMNEQQAGLESVFRELTKGQTELTR
ncbi:gliding motility-associated ABC transporter ATP-binding subunit GldA [Sunxiuqinia dokdonensis]|uniref:Gliding motility protein GldA n=1 Tax=Sunxiuqinia dokdonensis TaxID=1409788 RepID=A0A0L8V4V3_9BACT|nr:gliding motility-associated ABC transporter ATP-binding subunit GldA [Sunxiuqinia dokdonensis]KOH43212.1 gliding motility protein GldA [Sunxiuqinia dokdonensis]